MRFFLIFRSASNVVILEIMKLDQHQKGSLTVSSYLLYTAQVGNFGIPNGHSSSILYPFYISYPGNS